MTATVARRDDVKTGEDAVSDHLAAIRRLQGEAQDVKRSYAHGHDRPLGSYLAIMGAFTAIASGLGIAIARRGGPPEELSAKDLVLLSLATARLSRSIARDTVVSPLRAPFTRFEGTQGPAELAEEVEGTGPPHAIGELLTCPFCLGEWVAMGFTAGMALAPRATRLVASGLSVKAISDVLQFAWSKLEQST